MNLYTDEIAECRRRVALGNALNTLLKYNPDFKAVITDGLLHDEVLKRSLNINADESGTLQFLRAADTLKKYLDQVLAQADQAQADLSGYTNLIQDGR